MDMLKDFYVIIIVVLCLCVGYCIKNMTPLANKYIPTILCVVGVVANIWTTQSVTLIVIVAGMVSALASCKLYDMFRDWVEDSGNNK